MSASNSTVLEKQNGTMKAFLICFVVAVVAQCAFLANLIWAHPGSGIVVDERSQVFFTDTGNPGKFSGFIWKIDARGTLAPFHKTGGHWLALDADGGFARADFKKWFDQRVTPNFERVLLSDPKPTLIQTDGCPFVVDRDGNLYYAKGNIEIARLSPDGEVSLLAPKLKEIAEKLGGIKGLASGLDGSFYAACPSAILKIKSDGTVATLVHPIALKDCDKDLPPGTADGQTPFLRGLAVDVRGTVYAAATGCRCVVKITPGGKVETVLKAERPWSPTGVAVFGEDVYVLEYTNANAETHQWLPRVRKLGRDGRATTLATVSQGDRERAAQ